MIHPLSPFSSSPHIPQPRIGENINHILQVRQMSNKNLLHIIHTSTGSR